MERRRALVVEDDQSIQRELADLVADMGLAVSVAATLSDAIHAVGEAAFDLILVDLGLADGTGFELLRKLHTAGSEARVNENSETAVVVVSSTMDMAARNRSVELGARDFISKPFRHAEISRRLQRVLAAADQNELDASAANSALPLVQSGALRLDRRRRVVQMRDRSIALSEEEAALLETLMRNPSRGFDYSELSEILFPGSKTHVPPRVIRRLIRRIRRKTARMTNGRPVIVVQSPGEVRLDADTA